ncbi:GAF and ANTAR domain-containing protein [Phytoactinopolyspora halotolerans]|uniref:GAF and ANTAR domain-containing protein n=1 Tax=Phytoactinopolyspora halotolerans TaxID=1981512 RepID=A0A6L9SG27_9ACTN|nr:GAF and ANTAR domain-containing protein [Phytoactinopolyspora halotolerans]NEE03030.1 GAF and ANTAR domain-containing protein [Phytoactinopolyspora halotolerans]
MTESVSTQLATFARELHGEEGIGDTVRMMLEHASALTGCAQASVILGRRPTAEMIRASAPQAHLAAIAQVDLGEGPDVSAMSSQTLVVAEDIAADVRWRHWTPIVTDLGLGRAVSVRLGTQDEALGTLSLYSTFAKRFDAERLATLSLYAQHAAVAIATARRRAALRRAMDDRNLIGQAQGILVERHGLDAEEAYAMLQQYSRSRHVRLRDGADQVVSRRYSLS